MLTRRDLVSLFVAVVAGLRSKELLAKRLHIGGPIKWTGTPVLMFINGSPDSVDLSQWVHNPRGFALTYTVASGSLGELTLVGSVVSFDGSGPQSSTPVSFNISDGSRTKESPQTFATIVNEPVISPAVPVNVQADGLTQDTIRVIWTPGVGGPTPTSYVIRRSDLVGGPYLQVGEVAGSPFDDDTLGPNETRWYTVASKANGVESEQSTADAGTTLAGDVVLVSWTPPLLNTDGSQITNLVGYRVYGRESGGSYSQLEQVADPNATSVLVELGDVSGTWDFYVTAYDADGDESAPSQVVSAFIT